MLCPRNRVDSNSNSNSKPRCVLRLVSGPFTGFRGQVKVHNTL